MGKVALPSVLRRRGEGPSGAGAGPALWSRGRALARAGTGGALDVLHPVVTVGRGLGRLSGAGRQWWGRTPKERRGPVVALAGACLLAVWLVPYGLPIALVVLVAASAWYGRGLEEAPAEPPGPAPEGLSRLQAVYEALVPYFALPEDPHAEPLYRHDGDWERAVEHYEFTAEGRIGRLVLRYPAHFRDGEPEERHLVERVLCAKAGRGREFRFDWDEERNRLEVSVLAPLPTDIRAQHFVASPGETVLGFTDPGAVQRTLPVVHGEETRDVPPVVWRTGSRSTEPHLLALGNPGSGVSTLLRSVALQALRHGDLVVVDGGGAGEFACLAGRRGVLAVESSLVGSLAALEWVGHETERRLLGVVRAREAGRAPGSEMRRPLWVVVDRPAVLSHLAAAEQRRDPQDLLQVPLRHGRAARVTVVVAEQFEGAEGLSQAVRAYTRARVVLGADSPEQVRAVLGAAPQTTPGPLTPPGRGYARLGGGPVLRMQVPATPDPFDEETGEAERASVLALLPEHADPVVQAT